MEERIFTVIHSVDGEPHQMTGAELLNLIRVIAIPSPAPTDEKLPDEWLVITTRHN